MYLYCLNDPVNRIDPTGEFGGLAGQLLSGALRSALIGGGFGAVSRGIVTRSWEEAGKGFLFGFAGGFVSGGLASFSAAGYLFAAFEQSLVLQGLIAGGVAGATEGAWNREELRMIFRRAMVGVAGGTAGGALGQIAPPIGGIPGGVAGSQYASVFYEYFFSWFGDAPSLIE